MKTNKIIAGVSALVMAAANICAVSAQTTEENNVNTNDSESVTVTVEEASKPEKPVADKEDKDEEEASKPEKPEKPVADKEDKDEEEAVKPEKPEKPAADKEDKDEEESVKPEKPEKPAADKEDKDEEESVKPEKPEKPVADKEDKDEEEAVKPEKPEKPVADKEDKDEEETVKPEKPVKDKDEKPETPKDYEALKEMYEKFSEQAAEIISNFKEEMSNLLSEFSKFEGFEIKKAFGPKELKDMFREMRPEKDKKVPSGPMFEHFTGLKHFEVEEGNEEFRAEDGVLFDKDKKTLLAFPAGREDEEFKVPEGVEAIAPHAFNNCKHLKKIELPDTVKKIGKGAFENCENLEEVKLPEDIKVIEEDTFKNDENLKKVNKPEKLEVIEKEAFEGCEKLENDTKEAVKKHAGLKYGDINKNGSVDVTDLSTLAVHLIGDKDLGEDENIVADVTDDDIVSLTDLATMKQYISKVVNHVGPASVKDILADDETAE